MERSFVNVSADKGDAAKIKAKEPLFDNDLYQRKTGF